MSTNLPGSKRARAHSRLDLTCLVLLFFKLRRIINVVAVDSSSGVIRRIGTKLRTPTSDTSATYILHYPSSQYKHHQGKPPRNKAVGCWRRNIDIIVCATLHLFNCYRSRKCPGIKANHSITRPLTRAQPTHFPPSSLSTLLVSAKQPAVFSIYSLLYYICVRSIYLALDLIIYCLPCCCTKMEKYSQFRDRGTVHNPFCLLPFLHI